MRGKEVRGGKITDGKKKKKYGGRKRGGRGGGKEMI